MTEAPSARSRTSEVFEQIRADILGGRFHPGARLSPRELAMRGGVSTSVVREALTRLAEQGLVVAEPQLGFSVTRLDMAEVLDIARVRVLLEGEAFRDAIAHADVDYEARVLAAHHVLSRLPHPSSGPTTPEEADAWAIAHSAFHGELLSACASPRLRARAASMRDMTELQRRWSESLVAPRMRHRDTTSEHRALMQAALDHDADKGVELVSRHIMVTAELLADYSASESETGDTEAGPQDRTA